MSTVPLSDADLLAVALGLRGDEGKAKAAVMIAEYGGLRGLTTAPAASLTRLHGVRADVANRLFATLELAHRALVLQGERSKITSPTDAISVLRPVFLPLVVEEVHALYLDKRGNLLEHARLSIGGERYCIMDPAVILRRGILLRASGFILAHNHPSGDPKPSEPDIRCTNRLAELGLGLDVRLLDHIVLAGEEWISMRQEGLLAASAPAPAYFFGGVG